MSSIHRRLLAGIGLGVSLSFLASGVFVVVLARASLERQFDDSLVAQALAMSALVEQEGEEIESELGRHLSFSRGTEYYELWDQEGGVVERSASLGSRDLVPASAMTRIAVGAVTLPDSRTGRQVTLRFDPRQDTEERPAAARHTAVLALARGTEDVADTLARIGTVLVGVGIAGTLACILVLFWVVRFGLAPVRTLAAAIAEIHEADLRSKISISSTPAELRPVVRRLDALLARLAAAFSRERELTAEVAHELRTPLAGLRTTIEVALDRDRPADKYRGALADCLAITLQTQRAVESMLSLARLEAGTAVLDISAVDVDTLVRDVLAPLALAADQRGLAITTKLASLSVTTDREKLRAVIANLVDNAVTYTDANGSIEIELAGRELRVANTCTTLADASKVFERFWRGDSSRTGGTHAGLGLALSKKLVQLLGGSIRAEVANGRFVATLSLPA